MNNGTIDEVVNKVSRFASFMGISKSELKAYSILLVYGEMTAKDLSRRMNISYTKVYGIVGKLERRGWIRRISSKPVRYIAFPLKEVWIKSKREVEEKIQAFERDLIEPLSSLLSSPTPLYSVMVISGSQVIHEVKRILSEPKTKFLVAISLEELLNEEIRNLLISSAYRSIVRVLSTVKLGKEFRGLEIRYLDSMFGSGIITNDLILLVVRSGQGILGLMSDHQYFIDLGSVYFEYLWNQARP